MSSTIATTLTAPNLYQENPNHINEHQMSTNKTAFVLILTTLHTN